MQPLTGEPKWQGNKAEPATFWLQDKLPKPLNHGVRLLLHKCDLLRWLQFFIYI